MEQKYLKYKAKYLHLKRTMQQDQKLNLEGGNKETNVIVVTHNTRLRCFIQDMVPTMIDNLITEYNINKNADDQIINRIDSVESMDSNNNEFVATKTKSLKQIRFKNCAILLLEINISPTNVSANLSLVYDGDIDEGSAKFNEVYFVKEPITNGIVFPKIDVSAGKFDNLKGPDQKINIYLIRHAEGFHNTMSKAEKIGSTLKSIFTTSKIIDPRLSEAGQNQAMKAGQTLKQILSNKIINGYYVSDLFRTRETLSVILYNMGVTTGTMIVVPCTHELGLYSKNGNCDQVNKGKPIAKENMWNCNIEPKKNGSLPECTQIKNPNYNFDIDWSLYKKFYNNHNRKVSLSLITTDPGAFHCSKNNMIDIIVNYENNGHDINKISFIL
jgi:broad specificity phosphatase PhoE